jgi:hypothetical protein
LVALLLLQFERLSHSYPQIHFLVEIVYHLALLISLLKGQNLVSHHTIQDSIFL